MRILRAENYRRMKWKNGGGETAEIAVFPENAGLDDFGWRVSMATVASDGPFSAFPGVDRTLSVLDGEGIALDIAGRAPVTLTPASAPYGFPADAATGARLLGGPITDLNVMTRRELCRHKVSALTSNGPIEMTCEPPALLFCRSGEVLVDAEGLQDALQRFDAAILDGTGNPVHIDGSGAFLLVEFGPS